MRQDFSQHALICDEIRPLWSPRLAQQHTAQLQAAAQQVGQMGFGLSAKGLMRRTRAAAGRCRAARTGCSPGTQTRCSAAPAPRRRAAGSAPPAPPPTPHQVARWALQVPACRRCSQAACSQAVARINHDEDELYHGAVATTRPGQRMPWPGANLPPAAPAVAPPVCSL